MIIVKRLGEYVPNSLINKRVRVTKSTFSCYIVGDIYNIVESMSYGKVYPKLLKKDQNGIWDALGCNGLDAEFALVEEEEQLELFV